MKIYKYPFEVQNDVVIKMPKGANPLTVQEQNGLPYIWAIVDPKNDEIFYNFRIVGTGQEICFDLLDYKYFGTFQLVHGKFIGHMFIEITS
jgi:hypothetical protein